ncbi:MAG: phosphoglucosamine mutase [Bacteroidales bacterium]|nr:phosphoglucosamine mutase [Bacteroidales bacterium]
MALIKSISGIRGTIGGPAGENLTPVDIVKFTYAYCKCLKARKAPCGERYRIAVGRDARISGEMVEQLVVGTAISCGVDVIRCGLASTPTTELAVTLSGADGGIIITASHNPAQWNALKLLNERGEFLTAEEGGEILACAEEGDFDFSAAEEIGCIEDRDFTDEHIDAVLALDAVDADAVRKAGFRVVLDAVNSVGGIIMPRLLARMGVECITVNGEPTGEFAHNPEPLPEHLVELSERVVAEKADLGISVDPDVDRLAFICEDGKPFVEEYTLVAVADYLLADAVRRGAKDLHTVSNLSSSRALRDVTEGYGGTYHASAVGEVNVTTMIHKTGALIGGEGNGGVIYPACHCGRDAMVGVALFLSQLAKKGTGAAAYRSTLPQYFIAKNRIELSDSSLVGRVLDAVKTRYADEKLNTVDGVKVDFEESRSWVHLRASNTEPIIRIYAEAPDRDAAEARAREVIEIAKSVIGNV